jgi:ubiquitin
MTPESRSCAARDGLKATVSQGVDMSSMAHGGNKMKDRKHPDKPEEAAPMDNQSTTTAKKPKSQAALGRDIQAKIGQQLRSYYEALIEPTPDRFTELLRQLDKTGGKDPSE